MEGWGAGVRQAGDLGDRGEEQGGRQARSRAEGRGGLEAGWKLGRERGARRKMERGTGEAARFWGGEGSSVEGFLKRGKYCVMKN